MSGLLLDTHVALWLANADPQLRPATRALIDACFQRGESIFLSAVSAWELAMLIQRGRVDLDRPLQDWVSAFLLRPGTAAAPLTLTAAATAYPLYCFERRDPADRLLVATAIELGCPLVTYDRHILEFARRHGSQQRFTALK